jgi:hypothetical protein
VVLFVHHDQSAYLSSVRIVLTLVALIYDMSFLHMLNLVVQFVMIYILVLIWKLPNISTKTGVGPGRPTSGGRVGRHGVTSGG